MLKKLITISVFGAALFTLLFLSYWQLQRLAWKTDIIDRLKIEYQKDPTQYKFNFNDLISFKDETLPLKHGQVSGRFIYEKEILVGPKPFKGKIGYQVITPLKLKDNGYVLVNRGWVNVTNKEAIKKNRSHKDTSINGVFRKTDWNRFTPENSPENNIWTKLDIDEIAHVKDINPVVPVMLYASHSSSDFDLIIPNGKEWYPRNKHLQYAIFWFTMAFALVSVFGIFTWKNKKRKFL